jgi:hypothetical protein
MPTCALGTISAREASILACLADTVVDPIAPLPPVQETDAVAFVDRWLGRSPSLQRFGLRALLHLVELGPLLSGFRRRLGRLPRAQRLHYLQRLEHAPLCTVRQLVHLVCGMCTLAYYGDDRVMALLGYDADANVARGRGLREREGRP